MLCKARRVAALAAALLLLAALAGTACGPGGLEGTAIQPAPAGQAEGGPGLGPGTSPLSFGPGDKGSPRVSPSGERVAFVLDGAAAEKPLSARSYGRRTAEGFVAERVEWLSEENLAVLGREAASESPADRAGPEDLGSLFLTRPGDAPGTPPALLEVAEGAGAADADPGQGELIAAVATPRVGGGPPASEGSSKLLLVRDRGQVRLYPGEVPRPVTGLSVSPDRREAVLALAPGEAGETEGRVELLSYRFPKGPPRRVALLPEGMELLGAPQWTSRGAYFVAGNDPAASGEEGQGDFALYRLAEGAKAPEPVRAIGEGFLPVAICASPEGNRLAVVGRRSPDSPTNLYVLDLASEALRAVTTNENMEVKTNPRDLTWSPDGSYVVLVARVALSGPEVYDAPARSLSSAFYNLYRVPVGGQQGRPG